MRWVVITALGVPTEPEVNRNLAMVSGVILANAALTAAKFAVSSAPTLSISAKGSSFRPQPNNAAYVAAKHGVIGLTKVAALENGAHQIRVNAVAPGAIDTPMLRNALAAMGASEADFAPALSLLGRFGDAREVAQASLWLASDLAAYVTGTTINVDAGYANR